MVAVAGLAALGGVSVTPGVAAAAPAGSYSGPVALGDGGRYVLDGIDVDAQRVTLRMHIHNASRAAVTYSCPGKEQAAASEIVNAAGKAQHAIESYCQAHPRTSFKVEPGADFPVTGVFAAGAWTDGPFSVFWYEQTTPKLTLSGGRIIGGATPGRGGDDGGGWFGGNLWATFVLVAGALIIGGIWLRLLLRRGRFLVAVAAAGVAWFAGLHDWRLLLLVATLAALATVILTKGVPSLLGIGSSGSGGYAGGGSYAGGGGHPSGGWDAPAAQGPPAGGWDAGPGPSAPQPLDRGFYGDGPQHGTSRPADEPGSIWGDGPQHGTSTPHTEPGGFYSDRPFGGP
jgi:hypothetical protein